MQPESKKINKPLVAIVGPTAVGKTNLVLQISSEMGAEIVNVDSMQVYRYMDIGTAKPSIKEQSIVRHHLVDIADPDDEYNAQRFVNDANKACQQILAAGKLPLLTGGTGLYLQAFQKGLFKQTELEKQLDKDPSLVRKRLTEELAEEEGRVRLHNYLSQIDPRSAARIHMNDKSRMIRALEIFELTGLPWSDHLARQNNDSENEHTLNILKIGLTTDRETLYERINRRSETMIKSGLIDEVQGLLDKGYSPELKSMQSIGYKHIIKHLAGEWNLDETVINLAKDTRHYAKRQFTWFNKDDQIKWFKPEQSHDIKKAINRFIDQQ